MNKNIIIYLISLNELDENVLNTILDYRKATVKNKKKFIKISKEHGMTMNLEDFCKFVNSEDFYLDDYYVLYDSE